MMIAGQAGIFRARIISTICALAFLACSSTTVSTQTVQIYSDPPGAEVWAKDGESTAYVGATPIAHQRQVTVRETTTWPWWLLFAGGTITTIGGASSSTTRGDSADHMATFGAAVAAVGLIAGIWGWVDGKEDGAYSSADLQIISKFSSSGEVTSSVVSARAGSVNHTFTFPRARQALAQAAAAENERRRAAQSAAEVEARRLAADAARRANARAESRRPETPTNAPNAAAASANANTRPQNCSSPPIPFCGTPAEAHIDNCVLFDDNMRIYKKRLTEYSRTPPPGDENYYSGQRAYFETKLQLSPTCHNYWCCNAVKQAKPGQMAEVRAAADVAHARWAAQNAQSERETAEAVARERAEKAARCKNPDGCARCMERQRKGRAGSTEACASECTGCN